MWQRLQTLYLCLATGLVVALFFSVKAFTLGPGGVHAAELTYVKYTPYLILLILITILQLLAVFTFNARVFQMRTAVLAAILMIALQAWIGGICVLEQKLLSSIINISLVGHAVND